ncbi:procathepsin L-like isoform X2 [Hyaena hyaena]|uniref:procathepsin L-like isoform X2 n=1 Tax=Hyaena hyaena TaxID=95912 RepID=UPI001924F824|nr:procathepsin L-like isoform X2 [Hyaena hyaena]
MHPFVFLTALCLGIASAIIQLDQSLDAQWIRWKATHGKRYGMNEGWRKAVWEKNMKMIEHHNREQSQGKHSFTMAMNGFGDMGRCASGWAFSATGALEGQMLRKTGRRVSLSVQNLLDCSWPQGNEGCNGGLMSNAFQYVKNNGGLDTEESYPYVARDGPCKYRPEYSAVNVTAIENIPQEEEALMMAVANMGPISAAIDASLDTFRFYKGGIYYDPKCSSEDLNHGVLVVGYGFEGEESDDKKYWFVKNSWGTDWGMDGYIKMARDRDNHCGIATMASFPIV